MENIEKNIPKEASQVEDWKLSMKEVLKSGCLINGD